jgi:hypothetical protein
VTWCLEVRQAARVQTDEHEDDIVRLHDSFREWLGAARIAYYERERVAVVAASEDEARRFEQEAERLISEQDLFLIPSLYRRAGAGSRWERVTHPEDPIPDEVIEAELASFVERAEDESLR